MPFLRLANSLVALVFIALTARGADVKPVIGADAVTPAFQTPLATAANLKYEQAVTVADRRYAGDLEAAMKSAMQANNLDESNMIASALKAQKAGAPVEEEFKTAPAKTAKARHAQGIASAKQLYSRGLEAAQKAAMADANLDEANLIQANRSRLDEELKATGAARAVAARRPGIPKQPLEDGAAGKGVSASQDPDGRKGRLCSAGRLG